MKVSVIIPVFNGKRHIGDAIDSVLGQSGLPTELTIETIIVDNGSDDGTAELVRERYGSWVQLVREPRPGAALARNAGLARADGDAVAFLDADDRWLPDKLKEQCAALAADPDLELVFCHGQEFSDPPGAFPCRSSGPLLTCSGLLVRRRAFAQAGPFPEVRSGEFIAWYGWARSLGLRSRVIPTTLALRRVHAHNSTRADGSLHSYPEAMRWLLERRRQWEAGGR